MNKKIFVSLLSALILIAAAVVLLCHTGNSGIVAETASAAEAEESDVTADASAEKPADKATETAPDEQVKDQPFLIQITDSDPSIAYVLVRMPNPVGLLPLPLEGEYTKTIRRTMDDGSEYINVLHLTSEGFWMEDSNCEGHDCINEGIVTLSNREQRILWNMVICLPHQLSAELITREEALQLISSK